MTMQQKLRQLFLLDSQLRGMRSRLDSAISRLQKQKTRLEQLERQRTELLEQVKQAQVKASTFEKQVQEVDARVATLREQMNSVKNNKEYSALLIEVNTLKLDKTKVEDQALEQMGKVEELRKQVAEVDAKVADQKKIVGVGENEVTASRAEVGQQVDELTAKRDAAEKEIPADVRTQFKKLSEIHDGEALAGVTEENRRTMEYHCNGCYIGLPVERVNALMRRPDDVVCCPSCGRILYIEDELKAQLTATK